MTPSGQTLRIEKAHCARCAAALARRAAYDAPKPCARCAAENAPYYPAVADRWREGVAAAGPHTCEGA